MKEQKTEYLIQISQWQKKANRAKATQGDELRLLRLENSRKDRLIDELQEGEQAFLQKLHTKLALCFDHRLDMSLKRCQGIIREVQEEVEKQIGRAGEQENGHQHLSVDSIYQARTQNQSVE